MFGILDNKIRSFGSDVCVPAARLGIGGTPDIFTPTAQLHVQQTDISTASGIAIQGPDGTIFNMLDNGTGLEVAENGILRTMLAKGGNFGIGVPNPAVNLHVGNDTLLDGNLQVMGTSSLSSNVSLNQNLYVAGNGSIGGDLTLGSSIVVGENETIGQNLVVGSTLSVTSDANIAQNLSVQGNSTLSGHLIIGSSLTVTGNEHVNESLTISSNTTIGQNLLVGSTVSITSSEYVGQNLVVGSTLSVTSNEYVGQNLLVGGNSTLDGNLTVGSSLTITKNENLLGNLLVGSTVSITGGEYIGQNLIVGSTLSVTSNVSIAQNLNVQGNSTLSGNLIVGFSLTVTGNELVSGSLMVSSDTTLGRNLLVGSTLSITSSEYVGQNLVIGSTLSVTSNESVGQNLIVGGNSTLSGNLTVGSSLTITQNENLLGNLLVGSTVSITGGEYVAQNFVVGGNSTLTGNLTIGSSLTVTQNENLLGNLNVGSAVSISGSEYIGQNLVVGSTVSITSSEHVGQNLVVGSTLSVTSNEYVGQNLIVGGNSTLSGNLTVGSSLTVTQNENLLGNLLVGSTVSITGGEYVGQNLIVGSSLSVTSNANIAQNLNVQGNSTLSGNLMVGSTLSITSNEWIGQNLIVNGNSTMSGNLTIGSSLTITQNENLLGNLVVGSTVSITGSENIAQNLIVGSTCSISSNANIGQNLNVVGNTTLSSNLIVGSSLSVTGNEIVIGNVLISSSLSVSSNTVLGQNLTVIGNTTLSGNVRVGSSLTVTADASLGGNVVVGSALSVTGNEYVSQNLSVGGACSISSNISIAQNLIAGGNATVSGSLVIGSSLTISGNEVVGQNLSIGNTCSISNNAYIAQNLIVLGTISNSGTQTTVYGGNQYISGNLIIGSSLSVTGNEQIFGNLTVGSYASILGTASIGPYLLVTGNGSITQNLNVAMTLSANAFLLSQPAGSTYLVQGQGGLGSSLNLDWSTYGYLGGYPGFKWQLSEVPNNVDSLNLLQYNSSTASLSSRFFVNATGQIGIGTTSPAFTLDVNGNCRVSTTLYMNNQTVNQIICLNTTDGSLSPNSVNFAGFGVTSNTLRYQVPIAWSHNWYSSTTMLVNLNGTSMTISVPTVAPSMSVTGTLSATAFRMLQPGAGGTFLITSSGGSASVMNQDWSTYAYGIGNNPAFRWQVIDGGAYQDTLNCLQFSTTSGTMLSRFFIGQTGQIGINNGNPSYTLDVNGSSRVNGQSVWGTQTFHLSTEGVRRVFYGSGGRSYYMSGDGTHEWRTDSAGNVGGMFLYPGSLNVTGTVSANTCIISNGGTANVDYSTYGYANNNNPAVRWQMVDQGSSQDSINLLQYSSNAGTMLSRMFVNTSGQIGINTAGPNYTLDVNGSLRSTGILYSNNQTTNQIICLFTNDGSLSTNSVNFAGFGITSNTLRYQVPIGWGHNWYSSTTMLMNLSGTSLTINVPTMVSGNLSASGNLMTNGTILSSSALVGGSGGGGASVNIDWTTYGYANNNNPGVRWQIVDQLSFQDSINLLQYNSNTGTMLSRIFVNATGQIGINNSNPIYTLDVAGPARIGAFGSAYSTNGNMLLCNSSLLPSVIGGTNSWAFFQGTAGDTVVNSSANNPIEFKINNLEYARLSSTGLFGINTTSPAYTLDVNGSIRNTSVLFMNNQIANQMVCLSTYDGSISSTSTNYFGFGINNNTLRYNVPTGQNHSFFVNTSVVMNLSTNALQVNVPTTISGNLQVNGRVIANSELVSNGGTMNVDWSTYGYAAAGGNPALRWQTVDLGNFQDTLNLLQFNTTSGTMLSRMFMNGSGQIGIGNASPAYALDVSGSVRSTGILFMNNQAVNQMICLYTFDATVSSSSTNYLGFGVNTNILRYNVPSGLNHTFYVNTTPVMNLNSGALQVNVPATISGNLQVNGLVSANSALVTNGGTMNVDWSTYGYAAFGSNPALRWQAVDLGNFQDTLNLLQFNTTSGTMLSRIFVGQTGQIGINNINPIYTLDVSGPARIGNLGSAYSSNGNMFLCNSSLLPSVIGGTNSWAFFQGTAGDTVVNSSSNNPIEFKINNLEYARLSSAGLFGINTTTPAYTLDVNGPLRSSGVLYMNNQIANQVICLFTNDGFISSTSTNYYGFGVINNSLRYNVPTNQNHTFFRQYHGGCESEQRRFADKCSYDDQQQSPSERPRVFERLGQQRWHHERGLVNIRICCIRRQSSYQMADGRSGDFPRYFKSAAIRHYRWNHAFPHICERCRTDWNWQHISCIYARCERLRPRHECIVHE